MQEITILKEPSASFPFVLVDKPSELSSAPLLPHGSDDAFSQAAALFPELRAVVGRKPEEHGLLHRLDKRTAGLLLIAATQESYDCLQEEQAAGRFWKSYRAECSIAPENADVLGGFPPRRPLPPEWNAAPESSWEVRSYFRNFGSSSREVRPVTEQSGRAAQKKTSSTKVYRTYMYIISRTDGRADVSCRISSGYRHQVRCHLAWCGLPVIGDELYNAADRLTEQGEKAGLHFSATELDFYNPAARRQAHATREPFLYSESGELR